MGQHASRWLAAAVLVAVVVAAVACREAGQADFGDDIPDGAPHIDQRSLQFHPNTLTVQAGERVYFTNSETALHTIDVNGENISGDMRRGDVVVFTFEEPGEYTVTCPYHPQMRAVVTVVE